MKPFICTDPAKRGTMPALCTEIGKLADKVEEYYKDDAMQISRASMLKAYRTGYGMGWESYSSGDMRVHL